MSIPRIVRVPDPPSKRLRTHLRLAFHDWMWEAPRGGRVDAFMRRLCWRLPTYFTDPYMDGIPKDPAKFDAWFDSLPAAETTMGPPDVTLSGGLQFVPEVNSAATSNSARVINLRWTAS